MKKYSSSKEIETMVKELVRDGWAYCRSGKHGKLREPRGRAVLVVPGSPSDYRACLNFKRDVRHALAR